jgi:RNA polymerase sigma factor (sigma-70 family)
LTEALTTYQLREGILSRAVRENWLGIKEYVRSRVKSVEDAEDIVQDVFAQLSASLDVETPIERVTAWLYTVAKHRVIDWYRRRRTTMLSDGQNLADEGLVDEFLLADDDLGPERLYLQSFIWEKIHEVLDEMPPEQREVFVMNEFEGRSFREIAEHTGEPVNTLLSRKRYAILRMRERMRELYEELFL